MTSPELAVLIPSRGRPGNIRRVIGAWDFTNAWDVADMIVIVDQDDPEIGGYRDVLEETRHPDTGQPLIKLIEMPVWLPMVHKLEAVVSSVVTGGEYFALGFAGDDHQPQTINWAQTYLEELHKPETGMVYGDDGYQGRKLSTEWAVRADTVLALGKMVPAPVEHMYCDNSIMELYAAAGLLTHLPQVRIEHLHPIAGKAETDEQYRRVNSSDQFKRDRAAYDTWNNGQMSADLAKLKALRPGRPTRPVRKEKKMGNRSPFPHHFKQVKGVTPEDIGITLADFALAVPADQAIVELGVYHGKTALQMAWGATQGHGAHVWAVDPWDMPGNVYGTDMGDLGGARAWARYWVRSLGYANKISLVHGFSHEVAGSWSGSKIGLLFVDGDHTAEGARRDIESWAPHLAKGAVIAIDDYVNPNYPGVAEAVDALVSEGVLAPVEVYHERLGVTRLDEGGHRVTAVTSEGVSPSPEGKPDRATLEREWEEVDPVGVAALRESAAKLDVGVSTGRLVAEGELDGVPAGTPVTELTHAQAKTLARVRGITLGARKDKKSETLQALRDGQ